MQAAAAARFADMLAGSRVNPSVNRTEQDGAESVWECQPESGPTVLI
jgi:hypothetical protein